MSTTNMMVNALIGWPRRVASHFEWAGSLIARMVVGYTFMITGWGKLTNLPQITEYFASLAIPFPRFMTPFVSAWECFGGLFLILGLLTRISGGALAVTMIVAIASAQWSDVHSLYDLVGLEEATYFAVFTWFAIGGAGKASLDYLLEKRTAK